MTDELIRKLMAAGLTKQQASSITAETITNLYMNDDGKILIAEAKRQVDQMKTVINDLEHEYRMLKSKISEISDNLLNVIEAQKEHGTITDDKAKNIVALYASLLSMNENMGADPNDSVKNASYILYAYLGGQAKREITNLRE